MLDGIEALIALEKFGTVSEAATRLRLTQSAVSKRIQALQQAVGFRIVEPDGRRVRLTSQGVNLLERARPLVAELRALTTPVEIGSLTNFSLALADSIAASWGPAVVRRALQSLPQINVELHAHRSVLLIESVRLGRYHIGLCTDPLTAKDLIHYPLVDEPMVLIRSGLSRKVQHTAPLISIEPSSATWRAIEPLIKQHHPELLRRQVIPVESFSAAVQMVKAGFGDGLAPLGLAMEMGLDRRCYRVVPAIKRRVSLLARKTIHQLESFARLRDHLTQAAAMYFAKGRAG
jgi:DNA-binding transcriptional LysR family regulator